MADETVGSVVQIQEEERSECGLGAAPEEGRRPGGGLSHTQSALPSVPALSLTTAVQI